MNASTVPPRRTAPSAPAVPASTVRMLTVDDPWAALEAAGLKTREGRDTRPHIGWLFIHQSSRRPLPEVIKDPMLADAIATAEPYRRPRYVIALTMVTAFHEAAGCCGLLVPRGRYHWELGAVTRLTDPVFAIGKQGQWIPDKALFQDILARNPAAAARITGEQPPVRQPKPATGSVPSAPRRSR